MATVVKCFSVEGIEGHLVEIEATSLRGQQQMISVIGLGDQAVREAAERMQAAIESCGYEIPHDKMIISLAPGNLRKRGSHYDLAMTIALLISTDQVTVKRDRIDNCGMIGELSLNGKLRPCNGILPMTSEAVRIGLKTLIVPEENAKEAKSISGITVHGMNSLQDVIYYIEGRAVAEKEKKKESTNEDNLQESNLAYGMDFRDVKGQAELVDAIVLAAAGGHNILMIGEPGCGKSMIAQRMPTILPLMSERESLEVTKIQSISGLLPPDHKIVRMRPFRAPHHNISLNAMIGGGSFAMPGEVSLAHNGVLFLDELAEFNRSTLDSLRQPMEDKHVTISRVNGTNCYPANFMFVAAMNPCPCGYYPSSRCKCTDYEIAHYRSKISGPILDRIDIQKDVRSVDYFDLTRETAAPSSAELRKRVEKARKIQQERFTDCEGINCNSQMTSALVQNYCQLDNESTGILREASQRNGFSARTIHKLLKVARTSADLDDVENIRTDDIKRVLRCRDLDRSNRNMYTVGGEQ